MACGVGAEFLPRIGAIYAAKGVEMRVCPESRVLLQGIGGAQLVDATKQGWAELSDAAANSGVFSNLILASHQAAPALEYRYA